jgi:hypothetical protein
MSDIPPPTRWTLVARHPIRPAARQELFRLSADALLVARDLRGDDGRLLSELVVVGRLPELTDADLLSDAPLHDLLDGLPAVFWGEYGLGSQGDPRDELHVLHRYPPDRRETTPRRTAIALQAFHDPRLGLDGA